MQPIPGYTALCDNAVLFAQGDALDLLPAIPEASIDLALIDPPYNIGKGEWDKIEDYPAVFLGWVQAIRRTLKPNGVFIFWHNDPPQIAEIQHAIHANTDLQYRSIVVWNKTAAYRANSQGFSGLTCWFNICEFAYHYTVRQTPSTDHLNPLKCWYKAEMDRLGITTATIREAYRQATGKTPYMVQHYFSGNQFQIPTKAVWDQVFAPLGFDISRLDQSAATYTDMAAQYKALQTAYKASRPYFALEGMRGNIYSISPIFDGTALHPCQKPVAILQDMIIKCCPLGGTVLDCFSGSGSTGVAALKAGRKFIGIERDPHYAGLAMERIRASARQQPLFKGQTPQKNQPHFFCAR